MGRRQQGRGALELIEEATHLLRTAPGSVLALYGIGTLPFLLGFFWFWGDMSRNPFARQHVVEASLGLTALFVWMKFWKALFARGLRACAAGETVPLSWRECARVFTAQTILQPAGLLLLPLALLVIIPFAWTCMYFQHVTALGAGDSGSMRTLFKKAWCQAGMWPGQSVTVLIILAGFSFFVFLSWTVTCAALPSLLKMLLGVETAFSRSPFALLNTTFFMAMGCLTYMSVDPLLKAVGVLRCFYGEAQQSGEDLKAELRRLRGQSAMVMAAVFVLLSMARPPETSATEAASPEARAIAAESRASAFSPPDLDRTINEVINQRKFVWRLPRETVKQTDAAGKGIIGRFFDRAMKLLRKWIVAARDWLNEWLRKLFRRDRGSADHDGGGYGWIMAEQLLLYALVLAVAIALGLVLYRVWRDRNRRTGAVTTEAIQPPLDIADESVGAEQLPEDGWTRLADELLARGELRLALRAFYLGSLANLASRNLITLARFKSNRDYERELRRRAHAFAELLPLFGENVSVFDRTWYGQHNVDGELITHFAANVERIKSGA